MNKSIHKDGIEYKLPAVFLVQESGIGSSEFAGRIAYDSFDKSENKEIYDMNILLDQENIDMRFNALKKKVNNIGESELLHSLSWVHHHHSVIEHCNLTFIIKGTSRGVLHEIVRHRLASYTVRSTRYTMSNVLNAFIAATFSDKPLEHFTEFILTLDMFVTDDEYNLLEIESMFKKLNYQYQKTGKFDLMLSYSAMEDISGVTDPEKILGILTISKKKRNVGDSFKHIVTDNWKTDLVMTINLRSLRNFLNLRDSGAAYFLIAALAKEIKKSTPMKYLNLMVK